MPSNLQMKEVFPSLNSATRICNPPSLPLVVGWYDEGVEEADESKSGFRALQVSGSVAGLEGFGGLRSLDLRQSCCY